MATSLGHKPSLVVFWVVLVCFWFVFVLFRMNPKTLFSPDLCSFLFCLKSLFSFFYLSFFLYFFL